MKETKLEIYILSKKSEFQKMKLKLVHLYQDNYFGLLHSIMNVFFFLDFVSVKHTNFAMLCPFVVVTNLLFSSPLILHYIGYQNHLRKMISQISFSVTLINVLLTAINDTCQKINLYSIKKNDTWSAVVEDQPCWLMFCGFNVCYASCYLSESVLILSTM